MNAGPVAPQPLHGHDHGFAVFAMDMLDGTWALAIAGGIGIALLAGVLGCFIVWRRMAYFGDSLAHSSLLGIVLGMVSGIGIPIGVMLSAALFAVLLILLQQQRSLPGDTVLGVLAYGGFAAGLFFAAIWEVPVVDIHAFLFGNILAVTGAQVVGIYGVAALTLGWMIWCWPSLVLMSLDEDLARVEGVPVRSMVAILMILMALAVALAVKIAGILLVVAMMIIPAATARGLARTPEMMAVISSLLGVVSVIIGMILCAMFNVPSGPSIVIVAFALFSILFPYSLLRSKQ